MAMTTIKGPAIFLAQFAGDAAPFNSLRRDLPNGPPGSATRACRCRAGTAGCSISKKAAESKTYCDEVKGDRRRSTASQITELSTHLQGQLVAVHPAYDEAFDGFAAPQVRGNPKARQEWAVDQVMLAAKASQNLGLDRACHLLRRARLALSLSLAAAAGRPGRDRVRRAGEALEADPRRVRQGTASTSATRSIPARICTTA